MENWIDVITGFLIVSSALLLALGALSCLVLHVFNVRGRARLLICSMLMIMPVLYPIGALIPDRHKVPLPSEKIQAILPAISESGSETSTYEQGRPTAAGIPTATRRKPAAVNPSDTQFPAQVVHHGVSWSLTWKQAIAWIWSVLFVVILIRSALLYRTMKRLVDCSDCVTDRAVLKIFQQCLRETGLRRSPCLRVVHHTLTPMAVGFFHPGVILPARLLAPEFREGLRFALLHELKHLQRRDNWWLLLELIVGAVYFFHPVIYWAKRKIHEEWEHVCDRHVVEVTKKPASYADFLLHEIWNRHPRMNASLAAPLIFKARKTTQRVHCILEKVRPNPLAKIRDRIAVFTVFVCLGSIFLCTLTPRANVNGDEMRQIRSEWSQSAIKEKTLEITKGAATPQTAPVGNDPIPENGAPGQPADETSSAAKTVPAPADPEPAADLNGAGSPRQETTQGAAEAPAMEAEMRNNPAPTSADEETSHHDTESLPSDPTENTGIPRDAEHSADSDSLFNNPDLLAAIDPGPLTDLPEMPKDIPEIAAGGKAGQGRTGTEDTDAPSSENVAIPMGARIFDWEVVDERNIIIRTHFYGSFKATLAETSPGFPASDKDLKFVSNWPHELDEHSSIVLSNGKECKIQKLVPCDAKRIYMYTYDLF